MAYNREFSYGIFSGYLRFDFVISKAIVKFPNPMIKLKSFKKWNRADIVISKVHNRDIGNNPLNPAFGKMYILYQFHNSISTIKLCIQYTKHTNTSHLIIPNQNHFNMNPFFTSHVNYQYHDIFNLPTIHLPFYLPTIFIIHNNVFKFKITTGHIK